MGETGGFELASLLVGVLLVAVPFFLERRIARQALQDEVYQRIELAAVDLFRWEADHQDLVRVLWIDGNIPDEDQPDSIVFQNYICQTLSLFEILIRLRSKRIISHDVFASWVQWFYDLATAPGFRLAWPSVRLNYLPELRAVLDLGVILPGDEPESEHRAFFSGVGQIFRCNVISSWLD